MVSDGQRMQHRVHSRPGHCDMSRKHILAVASEATYINSAAALAFNISVFNILVHGMDNLLQCCLKAGPIMINMKYMMGDKCRPILSWH